MSKDRRTLNPYIVRFLKSIYQVQVNHLFSKYELELTNYLKYLLAFANQSEEFRAQQKYLDYGLDQFNIDFKTVPLIMSEVTVEIVEKYQDP